MLEITERASEVLERAYTAAARFNPDARIRIYRRGDTIETGLADSAEDGDSVIDHDGIPLFVAAGVEGILDVTPEHDRLVVRSRE